MALKIFWSKRADRKFDAIVEYLTTTWGLNVAKSFAKKVHNFVELAAEFPEIGSIENRERGIRGFVVVEQVTVFYKVKGKTLIVLNFFDNRQHPNKKAY